jgi:(1->4)-alpha-D-glucan 1-alpha-D-glucosylmutase
MKKSSSATGSNRRAKPNGSADWVTVETMEIVSTYRLQFHRGFTFRDAAAIVPYLHDLGVTHVYASPYLKSVAGSTHGYDVIDHSLLNPEIGTEAEYRNLVEMLGQHGMSHILDTVPNHMGVETNDNDWWNDVLARGQASKYAEYFDIDWSGSGSRSELKGKVLLAVLGETYGKALSDGLLKLISRNDQKFVDYHGRQFPIDRASDSSGELNELLEKQHYRLAHWKVAADEINYRRFFDISGLAALQMQRQEVFDAAHNFTFKLIADGSVAGLRVDHPDGLLDPHEYFERLQAKFKLDCPRQARDGKPLFVSVEKILNGDETLCQNWPVSGTSGYDFVCAVNDLFVDSANESAMTEVYCEFAGDRTEYADQVYREKCAVLDTAMYSEMASLTNRLDALGQAEVMSRDFTRHELHTALREVIACFPVYRSYVSCRGVSDNDIKVVDDAIAQAGARNPKIDSTTLSFIRDSVLLKYPVSESVRPQQLEFAQRFQQLTSPVNAKGIEDSTFYIYNRLASLNEVGGDPGRFGRSSDDIHRYFFHRQKNWPLSLSTLSTHDTKRSEDVRARINVLSEIPLEWSGHLTRWKQLNAEMMAGVHPNDQYLLYQTLLGAWPLTAMDDAARASFVARISTYMQKALREAKIRSSWIAPNEEYEALISQMIKNIIDPSQSTAFHADFLPFENRISRLGLYNSLSQTAIRLTAPGICDTYQGSELWDFSLVDPDNRRPVDYVLRQKMLANIELSPEALETGQAKLLLIRQLLRLRRGSPDLFLRGSYEPLVPTGRYARHLFAFARRYGNQCLIVVVPRFLASISTGDRWGDEQWDDTGIELPARVLPVALRNVVTGTAVQVSRERRFACANSLREFPVAALMAQL